MHLEIGHWDNNPSNVRQGVMPNKNIIEIRLYQQQDKQYVCISLPDNTHLVPTIDLFSQTI